MSVLSEDTKKDCTQDKAARTQFLGNTAPLPETYSEMETNPQLDFTVDDFAVFNQFDGEGPQQRPADEPVPEHRSDRHMVNTAEKYFPHGFMQEIPDVEPVRRGNKFGVLDILATLSALAVMAVAFYALMASGGLLAVRQLLGGDLALALSNIDDLRYFRQNQELTLRLYDEIAVLVMFLCIITAIFVLVHCYAKNQGIGIFKAVLLLGCAFGQAALCVGYFYNYLVTMREKVAGVIDAGLLTAAAALMIAVGVAWFISLFIWAMVSFFKSFSNSVFILLTAGTVLSVLLTGLHLLLTLKIAFKVMTVKELMQMTGTPLALGAFMVMTICAAAEDWRAKQVLRNL